MAVLRKGPEQIEVAKIRGAAATGALLACLVDIKSRQREAQSYFPAAARNSSLGWPGEVSGSALAGGAGQLFGI
jgi:hypothetical protein